MAGSGGRYSGPPSDRLALRTAVVTAALGKDGVLQGIPFTYAFDKLAQRWHVAPWVLEEAPVDWLLRGLEFQDIEAVKVTHE